MPNDGYRIDSEPYISRGKEVKIILDGKQVIAFEGETVATAMMAENIVAMRTNLDGEPRGVFCGMGVCFDCLVVVNGIANTRACMTWVIDGMQISTQEGLKAKKQA